MLAWLRLFSQTAWREVLPTAGLGTATALAWWALHRQQAERSTLPMEGMWMPPTGTWRWTFTDFGLTWSMWLIMMLAMMLPVVTPMIVLIQRIGRARRKGERISLPAFLSGYLLLWTGFSFFMTLLQWQFHGLSWLTPMMDARSTAVSGTILILSGAYQFTPWKTACLSHCRSPLGFLLTQRRRAGWRLGLRHGLYCVGCCWAEMLVMFAVGVMNLLWMGWITLAIVAERYVPGAEGSVRRLVGIALVTWGCTQWVSE
jgi:predicted metal-binding membrane protein